LQSCRGGGILTADERSADPRATGWLLARANVSSARFGRRRRADEEHLRLEEYDFYPFTVTDEGHIEFNATAFQTAVEHLLAHRNVSAARELIIIGEQSLVRDTFGSRELDRYKLLFDSYEGDVVLRENTAFLENYRRIVRLIGQSFPNTGIEILLHDLVNPAHSIVAIENGVVTGRSLGDGTTKLVLDLKTRGYNNQDKLNYELEIGGRKFKCTTIPIYRPEYGLVGAICINIDARFLREAVMPDPARSAAFIDNLLKTDMVLDENILSKDEYRAAVNGKRHFLDEAIRAAAPPRDERLLAAIMFSDVVGFTAMMESDEAGAMKALERNTAIHRDALKRFDGRLLKELGDGVLASFASVSKAVSCAKEIQQRVREEGTFQVRIGIHLGEVVQSAGDVFGDGVNLASRIQSAAEPGAIVVSEVVYNNVRNKSDVTAVDLGDRQLKNVSEPIRIFAIEL
jgi:class 3 adenylate cyclase